MRTAGMSLASAAASAAKQPQIAISDVEAVAVREPAGGRSYLIVTLKTDAGITGIGEASAEPDAATALARISAAKQDLIGQDALAAEAAHQRLALAGRQKGTDVSSVQAAVNMGLLDILGKLSKAPVYEALGGPTRNKARAFAPLYGTTDLALQQSLKRAQASGYRAFSVPLNIPEGPTRGRVFYQDVHRLLDSLRQAGGEDSDFILDCGGAIPPSEAAGLAAELEPFHLLWLEEPRSDIQGHPVAKVSAESTTPVGFGRRFSGNSGFQDLLRMHAIDILRPNIARLGVTQIRKAASLAETYYVAVAPYHRGGPIGTAAALHAAASIPNFFIQEVPFPEDDNDARMRQEIAGPAIEAVDNGFLDLPTGHGLGVTLDTDAIAKHRVAV